ncbi:MAG: formate dehydrogenase subunit gamma [Xanthobacteraceae bacterium]|nr:formate dehydrogenase subunit gamma [Xanthobacteraceae bacterium]
MDVVDARTAASHRSQGERWDEARALEIITEIKALDGATLPILHALQEAFGYVPEEAVALVAAQLNLSRADVYGVISFYHDFRRHPAGRHVVKLCGAEACQSMGGAELASCAERKLGIRMGETTADGRVTLEPVYCLGLCAVAPSAMVDGKLVGRLDETSVETLLAGLEA